MRNSSFSARITSHHTTPCGSVSKGSANCTSSAFRPRRSSIKRSFQIPRAASYSFRMQNNPEAGPMPRRTAKSMPASSNAVSTSGICALGIRSHDRPTNGSQSSVCVRSNEVGSRNPLASSGVRYFSSGIVAASPAGGSFTRVMSTSWLRSRSAGWLKVARISLTR